MSEKPLVSICLLTYNHAPYIRRTLDGFLMQKTDYPLEIVIHDDCSTDGAQDIIREYVAQNPSLYNAILQKENQWSKIRDGVTELLIGAAKGKYILFCEGDDYWTDPLKLQKQVDYMEAHPNCSMCIHAVNVVNLSGDGKGDVVKTGEKHAHRGDYTFSPAEIIGSQAGTACTCSYCMRREHLLSWPAFYKAADVGDYPLSVLLSLKGDVYYMDELMADYLEMHEGSWSDMMYRDDKKLLAHARCMEQMMLLLEEYSGHRYTEAVEKQLLYAQYQVALLSHDYKKLTSARLRRVVREHHGLKERTKFVLKRFFPFLEGIRARKGNV